jgi:hypothetical protein
MRSAFRWIQGPGLLAAALLTASLAFAQEADSYSAVSNTAMSITGDVSMDDFGITFETGDALAFSGLVADHFRVDGRNIPASVYSVTEPGDPEMLNATRCAAMATSPISPPGRQAMP